MLAHVAVMEFEDYNPVDVIAAVNELLPLGKEQALAQIGAARPQGYGLFWLLRTLFDLPEGQAFPPVLLGQPSIPPPANPQAIPRFPILIVQDVPLLVVGGYFLGGFPEPVEAHIRYFQAHGLLRAAPLAPPGASDVLLAEFQERWALAYGSAYSAEAAAVVKGQLARVFG
ncbi:hypothetical protein F8S13_19515 [Chloroflexia bacterium SDU3-3]|nr:hypothetical protein F8S13_19515 [Chloroflexia bacterium SDU3-3]